MQNVHATGIVIDGKGVLLRGASGSGKSLLALELIAARQAVLVGDDRLDLQVDGQTLLMAPPPRLAGLIELRGRGIIERPYMAQAQVHLIIDLGESLARMPEDEDFSTAVLGVKLARCPVPRRGVIDGGHQLLLVSEALRALQTASRA